MSGERKIYNRALMLDNLSMQDVGKKLLMGNSLTGKVKASKLGQSGVATTLKQGAVRVEVEYRYFSDGKTHALYLGVYPKMSLKEINQERERARLQIQNGIDPKRERKAQRVINTAAIEQKITEAELTRIAAIKEREQIKLEEATMSARITVKQYFNTWLTLELSRRKHKGEDVVRVFEKDVFPYIGDLALEDVKRSHIQQMIDNVVMRGAVRMSKLVLSSLRQMFNSAVDRELIEIDPTARIKKKSLGKDIERDRVLSHQEILELFRRFNVKSIPNGRVQESFEFSEIAQLALKLQFATMARIGEVLSANWCDIDLENRLWFIPETKNGLRHEVYLSDWSVALIERLRTTTKNQDGYLFPSSRTNTHICSKTITKQVADRQRGENLPMSGRTKHTSVLLLSGGQWRPHDLRRTGATLCAKLGILPEVIEKCLNHVEQSKIKRIYQRASYSDEKAKAWQVLGDYLFRLESEAMIGK